VEVLVGGDDRGGDFRPRQQLAMIGRDEIRADARANVAAAIVIELGNADPFDGGVTRRHFAAEQADAAGADNGETDALGGFLHEGLQTRLTSPACGERSSKRSERG